MYEAVSILLEGCKHRMDISQASSEESQVRTFDDVLKEDAAFRKNIEEEGLNFSSEAEAFRRLLEGKSAEALSDACTTVGKKDAYLDIKCRWTTYWANAPTSELAKAVQHVVTDLDAPHLLPSGIEKRLLEGVKPSCYGFFALWKAMQRQANCVLTPSALETQT